MLLRGMHFNSTTSPNCWKCFWSTSGLHNCSSTFLTLSITTYWSMVGGADRCVLTRGPQTLALLGILEDWNFGLDTFVNGLFSRGWMFCAADRPPKTGLLAGSSCIVSSVFTAWAYDLIPVVMLAFACLTKEEEATKGLLEDENSLDDGLNRLPVWAVGNCGLELCWDDWNGLACCWLVAEIWNGFLLSTSTLGLPPPLDEAGTFFPANGQLLKMHFSVY